MPPTENVESTLIWYKGTDSENFKHWVDSLQDFLKGELFFSTNRENFIWDILAQVTLQILWSNFPMSNISWEANLNLHQRTFYFIIFLIIFQII